MFKVFSQRDGRGHIKEFASSLDAGLNFSPASIPGLRLWLAADTLNALGDGAAIASWADGSGNGYNATASGTAQPIYKANIQGGLPVVRFNGTSQGMNTTAPGPIAAGCTVLAVAQIASATSTRALVGSSVQGGLEYRFNSAKQDVLAENVADLGSGSATWDTAAFRLYELVIDGAGNISFFVNGAADGTSTTTRTFVSGNISVGINPVNVTNGNGEWFSGDMGEVVVYNRPLTNSERLQLENQLRSKWAV